MMWMVLDRETLVTAVSDLEKLSVWIALRSPPAEEGNNTGVSCSTSSGGGDGIVLTMPCLLFSTTTGDHPDGDKEVHQ